MTERKHCDGAAGIILTNPSLYDIAELPVLFDMWWQKATAKKKKKKKKKRTPPPKPPFPKHLKFTPKRSQASRQSRGSARTDDEGSFRGSPPLSTAPRHQHTALRRLLALRDLPSPDDDCTDGTDHALSPYESALAEALASEDAAHDKLEWSEKQIELAEKRAAAAERKVGDTLAQLEAALTLLGELRGRLSRAEAETRASEASVRVAEARAEAAEAREKELLRILDERDHVALILGGGT